MYAIYRNLKILGRRDLDPEFSSREYLFSKLDAGETEADIDLEPRAEKVNAQKELLFTGSPLRRVGDTVTADAGPSSKARVVDHEEAAANNAHKFSIVQKLKSFKLVSPGYLTNFRVILIF